MVSRIDPLPAEDCKALEEAALDGDPEERLIVQGVLYGGMRQIELRHLRRSWLDDDFSTIRIPPESRCTAGGGTQVESHPCHPCQKHRGGVWRPRREQEIRAIPVWHEGLRTILRWWFYDHESVSMTNGQVRNYLDKVADRAGVDREKVERPRLRHAHGVLLARNGFDRETIRQVMGYKKTKLDRNGMGRLFHLYVEEEG